MGAVDTTYTFTATDTITSTKMNNIIDQTTMTNDAIWLDDGLEVASGKIRITGGGITSSKLATGSVTSNAILDGTIVNADINASAAIAGTKISPAFGTQNISNTGGNLSISNTGSCVAQTTSGTVTGQLYSSSASSSVAVGSVSNNPLVVFTNNAERMRITAAGNVGIGTSSPSAPLEVKGGGSIDANPDIRVSGSSGYIDIHNSLSSGSYNNIVSSGDKAFIFSDGTSGTGNLVIAPWASGVGGIRINSSGNVGICKSSPSTALDVNGTVTATAFSGPLTGNVTGNASTATTAASCSGNSATATLATKASTLSQGGGNGTAMTFNWSGQVGQPTWLWGGNDGTNHYVYNPSNFSVNYANSAGSASTATTATTVSNGAITAAKLNGAQSGNAPIFGVRAWVNFNGTSGSTAIRQQGNVSSVSRTGTGLYTVNLSTPVDDTDYAIVGFARDAGTTPGNYFVSAVSNGTKTTSSFQIRVHSTGGLVDSPEINIMVIR